MRALEQAAALVALLRERPGAMGWSEIAAEVAFTGDATVVWEQVTRDENALIASPGAQEAQVAAHHDVEAWDRAGLRMLSVLDPEYPQRLLDIRETPPFVFAAGQVRADDAGMSVVGSRRASDHGRKIAEAAARLLVGKGLTVIAGLAAGIDTVAHRAALDADGRTVAFLGTGITRSYPAENRGLQEEIAQRGLVLSQFWPDSPPSRRSFPIRNAAMSGYGLATIVVEAGETSGARIQARLAVEHGRPVILTDAVATTTRWGAALADRPGVHVVSGVAELDGVVDKVLAEQDELGAALRGLDAWVA